MAHGHGLPMIVGRAAEAASRRLFAFLHARQLEPADGPSAVGLVDTTWLDGGQD